MKGRSLGLIFALTLAILWPSAVEGLVERETCWERCFRNGYSNENGRFRDVYKDVLDIILDIRAIINTNNITKVGFAIDSSISQRRDPIYNPRIYNSRLENQTTDYIFYFEYMLAHVLLFGLDNAPYMVQYDQESAWGCKGFQCGIQCKFTRGIRWWSPAEVGSYTHCPDNLEAACSLLGTYMTTLVCPKDGLSLSKGVLVAIANSNFYSSETNFKDDDPLCKPFHKPEGISAPCTSLFDHRYVISIHGGSDHYMKMFASSRENFKRVPENLFTYNAVKSLFNCVNAAGNRPCCPPGAADFNGFIPIQCDRTVGAYGETISNFPNHFALAGAAATPQRFLPAPP